MTKQEILDEFDDINYIYNNSSKHETLSWMLDELLKEPEVVRCKDCIHWDKGHTEECDNLDSVCFHNGWCKPDWFCPDGERG